jgi:hypothetical protein
LEEIHEYANSFIEIGPLSKSYEVKILMNEKKESFEHKHIIFYADFHFKRIICSKPIIINGTYVFPHGFSQTLIIMYHDIIINRFIPGIIILTNNHKYIGYIHIFNDILENIQNYEKSNKARLNWESFTSDFEKSLIKSFKNTIAIKYDKIQHYGCYFHFLQRCRSKLISKGLGTTENIYLKDVDSIFRTNNALENYNRIFKHLDNMRANMVFSTFIDNIKDEFIRYKNLIEDLENKGLNYVSKSKKKN